MNIVNVGYDSTNYYILADSAPRLLVDVGFPGTLAKLQHACKRMSIKLADIPYLFCTHYHPDHAGLAGELQQAGMKLIVIEEQRAAVPAAVTHMKPEYNFVHVDMDACIMAETAESRALLAHIGIKGEMLHTPGHSDDSITLILDEGAAFTGDLYHPTMVENEAVQAIWQKIRALKVKMVYPGHGPAWKMTDAKRG